MLYYAYFHHFIKSLQTRRTGREKMFGHPRLTSAVKLEMVKVASFHSSLSEKWTSNTYMFGSHLKVHMPTALFIEGKQASFGASN